MKKLLILLLSAFIFSCQQKPKESKYDIIEKAENEALATGINGDTIFLDFRFGMTESEMHRHFKKLMDQGKIKAVDNSYVYEFTLEHLGKRMSTFSVEFYNDSLYDFTLIVKSENKYEPPSMFLKLSYLYLNKYKFNTIEVPNLLNEEEEDHIYFYGNQKVYIRYPSLSSNVNIEYTDIIRERAKKEDEKRKRREKQIQNINDI